ncbi:MAG TPA: type II secretion system F family protein [Streptosporangiaceae bacterium]|nr:type II secretion system F family protein [Streptosporangiaceae bacterium]
MTAALILGAVGGGALWLMAFALMPRRAGLARQIATFDSARPGRGPGHRAGDAPGAGTGSQTGDRVGAALAAFCAEQGWEFPSLRANLSLVGKSFENYLATKVMLGLFGFLIGPIVLLGLSVAGIHLSFVIPLWVGLILGGAFFFLPDLELRQSVTERRRDFRHAIGVFLDLVSMNLAGGRGVPEALMAASEIGSSWALGRIRDALANARITGQTPWQALGALGDEVRVDELRDLSAALSLVADDGAKVRESLTARAVSLRRRELADLEGQAGERSQSMLVAQMLLCAGFLVFLTFPVIGILLGAA